VTSVTEELYSASLPWIREQAGTGSAADRETANRAQEILTPLVDTVEASAATIEGSYHLQAPQDALRVDESVSQTEAVSDGGRRFESFEQLAAAVRELSKASNATLLEM
jgi:hypothetical protein